MAVLSIVGAVWVLGAAIALIEIKRAPLRDDFDRRNRPSFQPKSLRPSNRLAAMGAATRVPATDRQPAGDAIGQSRATHAA